MEFNLPHSKMTSPLQIAMSDETPDSSHEDSVAVVPVTQKPKMFKVILLNDDYTPMDFVILVLRRFFGKSETEATEIMLDVHKKGHGIAGVFTLEIAEMKVMQVNQFSQMNQHPLKSSLEEE
jgi:ATP-dependent Clp protease adaptor protein ClpS